MFFTFNQNNSGGQFDLDGKVCHYVIVEADDYRFANIIAEDIGIYFDGCNNDMDCPCCGDRWSSQWDNSDGTIIPMIYNRTPEEFIKDEKYWFEKPGEVFCRIYYKDGKMEEFKRP